MSCPTCDHTMQLLAGEWFWCPRCGTVKHGERYRTPFGVLELRSWLLGHYVPYFSGQEHEVLREQFLHPDERERCK
jgi:hypothetical protein